MKYVATLIFLFVCGAAPARMEFTHNVPVSEFPERLRAHVAQHPIDKGFVDITKPPYGAAGDGVTDDTEAIQNAIDDAFESNLCVLFPEGTYLVSRQLRCIQRQRGRQWSNHKFAQILVGATGGKRPVIKARDGLDFEPNAVKNGGARELIFFQYYADKVFKNRFNPKGVKGVYRASVHYSSQFRGIDIDMGNNPEYSAISMTGAQYCAIEDVTITGNFDAGIVGLPGCGGGTVNVRIVGGKVGIRQLAYRPCPTVTGVVCEGQSRYGIQVTMSMGPIVLTGFRIVAPEAPSPEYRAISTHSAWDRKGTDQSPGALVLTDGSIEVPGDSGTAITNWDQDIVMRNVYVKAATVIESGFRNRDKAVHRVTGDADAWRRVGRYVFSPASSKGHVCVEGKGAPQGTMIDGNCVLVDPLEDGTPAPDLVTRHIWKESGFPLWSGADVVDIARDFGATPEDDSDDDAVAIQKAIDATTKRGGPDYGKTVFIPRGHFHIGRPVIVRNGAKIVGAANTISVIQVAKDWKPTETAYVVDTDENADGSAILAHFAILGHKPLASAGTESQKRLGLMRVRLGDTTIRDVQFARTYVYDEKDFVYETPTIVFGAGSGGSTYHFSDHHSETGTVAPSFRKILIENNARPIRMYQISVEHIRAGTSGDVLLDHARDVAIYGLKHEGVNHIIDIVDSGPVRLWGGLSNGAVPPYTDALVHVQNSPDTIVAIQACYAKSVGKARLKTESTTLSDDRLVTYYEGPGVK